MRALAKGLTTTVIFFLLIGLMHELPTELYLPFQVLGSVLLFVAIPEAFEAGQIVQQARRANPGLPIVARAHFDAEVEHLLSLGASKVIMGEREIALAMLDFAKGQ